MTTPNQAYREATNSPAARQATQTAKSLGDQVSDFAENVSDGASKQFTRAQDMAGDAYDITYRSIRSNPMTAVAVALGVGFLLGALSTRR